MNKVTVKSSQACLDEQGNLCPVEGCGNTNLSVTAEPGNESDPSREHFVCRSCNTEWSVHLYAAQISSLMLGDTGIRYYTSSCFSEQDPIIEPGVFQQVPCPKGPVADAVKELIKQMKIGSVQGKGEALAKLAFLARVDLNSLTDNQPSELPEPLSGTE